MGGEGAIGHSSVVEESYGDLLFEVLGYGQGMEQGNVGEKGCGDEFVTDQGHDDEVSDHSVEKLSYGGPSFEQVEASDRSIEKGSHIDRSIETLGHKQENESDDNFGEIKHDGDP